MVDIEQHALRAFEQDGQILIERAVDDRVDVDHMVGQLSPILEVAQVDLVQRKRWAIIELGQELIFEIEHLAQPAQQRFLVKQIAHTDADARHFIGVGWADAAAGGADLKVAAQSLVGLVLDDVVGHHHVGALADEELGGADGFGLEIGELFEQHGRVDDHAVADHIDRAWVEDARRHDVQLELAVLVQDGVAGVVAPAIADHQACLVGQQIDNVAFAFVAPLGADHSDDRHSVLPSRKSRF